jgi:hypothetical protein
MDTPHPSRRAMLVGLGSVATGLIAARYLQGSPAQAQLRPAGPGKPIFVPSSGAWFGAYPGGGNISPAGYEAMTKRKLDIVMRYEALDGVWPNANDLALVADGRWLSVCWSSRLRATGTVATWADVAAGKYDAQITAQAHRLAAVGNIWVGYDNEMDGHARIAMSGPLSNYAAAYRHIQQIVRPIAPNVVWIWCPTGNNRTEEVAACYPGEDYVDWICYDPYDPTLSKGSPYSTYVPFRHWQRSTGVGIGKPLGICETGFQRSLDNSAAAASWIRAVPQAMADLHIRMWQWFNSYGGLGDTSIAPGSPAAAALQSIGTDPWFTPAHW